MAGFNANYGGAIVYLDVSEAVAKMNQLATVLAPNKAHELFRRTLTDAGKQVKQIAKSDIPNEYVMKPAWIGSAVGFPQMIGTDSCKVIIKNARGSIGGVFPASGGAYKVQGTTVHMADGTTRQRKAHIRTRAIRAKIVTSNVSTLPSRMPAWQGGQPPFMMGGLAMTRSGASRFPIHKVVGLAVPQPPVDRSHDEMQQHIEQYMMQRLEHHFWHLFDM